MKTLLWKLKWWLFGRKDDSARFDLTVCSATSKIIWDEECWDYQWGCIGYEWRPQKQQYRQLFIRNATIWRRCIWVTEGRLFPYYAGSPDNNDPFCTARGYVVLGIKNGSHVSY